MVFLQSTLSGERLVQNFCYSYRSWASRRHSQQPVLPSFYIVHGVPSRLVEKFWEFSSAVPSSADTAKASRNSRNSSRNCIYYIQWLYSSLSRNSENLWLPSCWVQTQQEQVDTLKRALATPFTVKNKFVWIWTFFGVLWRQMTSDATHRGALDFKKKKQHSWL